MSYVQSLFSRKTILWLSSLVLLALSAPVFATGSDTPTFGGMAAQINASIPSMTTLIASIAYLGGIGFAVVGILKFKQHKENPQQTTLGVPITMIFVAAALIFLPTMIKSTGKTVTGGDATMGSPEASGTAIWSAAQ